MPNACVVAGGVNNGTINQTCNFGPIPLAVLSKDYARGPGSQTPFMRSILVRLGQPAALAVKACGDDIALVWVTEVDSDVQYGPVAESTTGNCIVRTWRGVSGRALIHVETNMPDSNFTLALAVD
jgi:hypothetical protein